MTKTQRLGYDRGASDKLAGRPFDPSPPDGMRGSAVQYRQYYSRGYHQTAVVNRSKTSGSRTGDGFDVNLSANLNAGTPAPPPEPPVLESHAVEAPPARPRISPTLAASISKMLKPPPTIQMAVQPAQGPSAMQSPSMVISPPKSAAQVLSDWLAENWQLVAAGVGVVVVGAIAYKAMSKDDKPQYGGHALPPMPHTMMR